MIRQTKQDKVWEAYTDSDGVQTKQTEQDRVWAAYLAENSD